MDPADPHTFTCVVSDQDPHIGGFLLNLDLLWGDR